MTEKRTRELSPPCAAGPLDLDSPNAGLHGDDMLIAMDAVKTRDGRVWRQRDLADPIRCLCHEYVEVDLKTFHDKVPA